MNYKRIALVLASALVFGTLSGCGCGSGKEIATPPVEQEETVHNTDESVETESQEESPEVSEKRFYKGIIDVSELETEGSLVGMDLSEYVTLPENYKEMKVEVEHKEITEEALEEYMDEVSAYICGEVGYMEEGEVGEDDSVELSFVFKDGNDIVMKGDNRLYNMYDGDNSNCFPTGTISNIVGMKAGETKSFVLNVDAETDNLFKGKTIECTVTVHSIYQINAPEYTEENIRNLAYNLTNDESITTIEGLKAVMKDQLQQIYEEEAYAEGIPQIREYLLDNSQVKEVPDFLYNKKYAEIADEINSVTSTKGIDVDDCIHYLYGEYYNDYGTYDLFIDNKATKESEEFLIFHAVANDLGIEISDELLDNYIQGYLEGFGIEDEEYIDRELIRESLLEEAVLEELARSII